MLDIFQNACVDTPTGKTCKLRRTPENQSNMKTVFRHLYTGAIIDAQTANAQ